MKDETVYKCGFYFLLLVIICFTPILAEQMNKKNDMEYLIKRMNEDKCEKAGGVIFKEKCVDKTVFIDVEK